MFTFCFLRDYDNKNRLETNVNNEIIETNDDTSEEKEYKMEDVDSDAIEEDKELEEEDLSVMREMEIKSHIKTIDNNVQKVRMEGLL